MLDAQRRRAIDEHWSTALFPSFWFGMTIHIPSQRHFKSAYWLSAGTVEQRLAHLLSPRAVREACIDTTKMSGNSAFVNYVYRHTITERSSGQSLEIIEKSIKKLMLTPSSESSFYRERSILARSSKFRHPRCYGVIETPFESIIFTRFVNGRPPRMADVCGAIARGISELECITHAHLNNTGNRRRIAHWCMSFFQPWYLLRPKYNHSTLFKHLDLLGQTRNYRMPTRGEFKRKLSPLIAQLKSNALSSPRCFSHLDYLRKNLIQSKNSLFLIDWSEVRIGRIGFDSGAYLSNLFRNSDIQTFETLASKYLTTYYRELPSEHRNATTANNILYIFLLHSTWYCMRKDVIKNAANDIDPAPLGEKLDYLLNVDIRQFQPTQ